MARISLPSIVLWLFSHGLCIVGFFAFNSASHMAGPDQTGCTLLPLYPAFVLCLLTLGALLSCIGLLCSLGSCRLVGFCLFFVDSVWLVNIHFGRLSSLFAALPCFVWVGWLLLVSGGSWCLAAFIYRFRLLNSRFW